jgi:hypothetical protein
MNVVLLKRGGEEMVSREILDFVFEDDEGGKEALGEVFKKAPLTVLVCYRGSW